MDSSIIAGPPAAPAARQLNGEELRAALAVSADWLDRHAEAINALNVFPVPDGDTGLNMSLTLRAAVDEALALPHPTLSEVGAAFAHGALMGARGNSGVILAQLLRGVARALADHDTLDGKLAAAALVAGANAAYAAVTNPVEGTILSVARAAGAAAQVAAGQSHDLVSTLDLAHQAARDAVAHTPEQLDVLRQAGVVDAGGEGLRVIIEGLLAYARGEHLSDGPVEIASRADLSALHQETDDFYGYCTEVLFSGAQIDIREVQTRLTSLGTCLLVVGDAQLLKVHIHTLRPGAVLDLATEMGELIKVKVDNMQQQHARFVGAGSVPPQAPIRRLSGTSLVAVAVGAGFEQLFTSLGARVVTGAQTMNPSVEQLVAAIADAERDDVIIAVNDPNVVLTAQQAVGLIPERHIEVLHTRTMPQGIVAALALNPEADASANLTRLEAATRRCRVVAISRAVRNAQLGDIVIERGAFFSLLDGEPVAAGQTPESVLAAALQRLPAETPPGPHALVTVYWGTSGSPDGAQTLADLASTVAHAPETLVEFGGQPQYDYLVCLE